MPEGDTIFKTARTLNKAIGGQLVTGFESNLPKLTRVDFDSGVVGREIEKVDSHGKWLMMHFSGNLILLTHMLMNGSWHIYRPAEPWQKRAIDMRIVIKTEKIWAVAFNVPIAEFHTADTLHHRDGFKHLGQDVLSAEFNAEQAAASLRSQGDLEVGAALLTQSLIAGLGNVYKSEICFACKINPFRKMADLRDEEVACLVDRARNFLLANVVETSAAQMVTYTGLRRTTGRANREERLWVYGRRNDPCRECGAMIQSRKQGIDARVTFWCPQCQPMASADGQY